MNFLNLILCNKIKHYLSDTKFLGGTLFSSHQKRFHFIDDDWRLEVKINLKKEKLKKYCLNNNLIHPSFDSNDYLSYKRHLNLKSNEEIKERLLKENEIVIENECKYNFYKYKNAEAYFDYDFNNIKKTSTPKFFQSDEFCLSDPDILIVGGGLIGTAIAYYLKSYVLKSNSIHVIDKDLSYSKSTSVNSLGLLHQQFKIDELIYMAKFSAAFMRKCRKELSIDIKKQPLIDYWPIGNLVLIKEKDALERIEIIKNQIELGQKIEVLNKKELKERYSWLNLSDDIALGSISLENEGYIDPAAFLSILRSKAENYGVNFYEAELIDFNPETNKLYCEEKGMIEHQLVNDCFIKTKKGDLFHLNFGNIILATGRETPELCKLLKIGDDEKDYSRGCPSFLKERKQQYFEFECLDGPGIDFPFLIDPSGVLCKPNSITGKFITGKILKFDEINNDLENDPDYFEKEIKPILIERVPCFKNLKIIKKWSQNELVNTFDGLPIIGNHPYYENIIFASGFGLHSAQFAPSVGRYITDKIYNNNCEILPLERLGWERLLMNYKLEEKMFI